jgi:hypothetical protein
MPAHAPERAETVHCRYAQARLTVTFPGPGHFAVLRLSVQAFIAVLKAFAATFRPCSLPTGRGYRDVRDRFPPQPHFAEEQQCAADDLHHVVCSLILVPGPCASFVLPGSLFHKYADNQADDPVDQGFHNRFKQVAEHIFHLLISILHRISATPVPGFRFHAGFRNPLVFKAVERKRAGESGRYRRVSRSQLHIGV